MPLGINTFKKGHPEVSQSGLVLKQSMSSSIERLLEFIVKTTSFNASDEPRFRLASGELSKYYVDCKIALSYAEVRKLIGGLIAERIQPDHIDAVGGLALGAYPIAVAVSDACYDKDGTVIRSFVVRKEPKPHGLGKYIEGDIIQGDRVLIVDDVITSGSSTVNAIRRSRDEGLEVIAAIAVIDRQESNGANTIEETGVPFSALLTLQNLIDVQAILSK